MQQYEKFQRIFNIFCSKFLTGNDFFLFSFAGGTLGLAMGPVAPGEGPLGPGRFGIWGLGPPSPMAPRPGGRPGGSAGAPGAPLGWS